MAIGCASNNTAAGNTAAGNTAAGREVPRVLWLTRPGCCSIVSLSSLSKSRIWIENGQKGPHAADKSCSCLIESGSRSISGTISRSTRDAPGRSLRASAGTGEPAIGTLNIIKISKATKKIQRPAGTTNRLGRGWRKLPPECANLVDHQRQHCVRFGSNCRLPFS